MDNDTPPENTFMDDSEVVGKGPKPKKLFRYSFLITSVAQVVGWGWLIGQHQWAAVAICIVMIANFSIHSHMQHFNAHRMLGIAARALGNLHAEYESLREEHNVIATHMREVHGMELEQGRAVRTMAVNHPNNVN